MQRCSIILLVVCISICEASLSEFFQTADNPAATQTGLGGCGWGHCYNCTDRGKTVHCGPAHQTCIKGSNKPNYTFHLIDPTCDINDPVSPYSIPSLLLRTSPPSAYCILHGPFL